VGILEGAGGGIDRYLGRVKARGAAGEWKKN